MIVIYNDRQVEIELFPNRDGIEYIREAYYVDTGEPLDDVDVMMIQQLFDDEFNS